MVRNDIEMYSTHNEAKSVIVERFNWTLRNKTYKYMTSVSKTVYVDKFYSTIKMKPVDVKSNAFIDSSKEINEKDPKFIIGDNVTILKYKNVFAKAYVPNWSEEIFVIKKVKNTVPCRYVITDLKGEKNVGTFYEN